MPVRSCPSAGLPAPRLAGLTAAEISTNSPRTVRLRIPSLRSPACLAVLSGALATLPGVAICAGRPRGEDRDLTNRRLAVTVGQIQRVLGFDAAIPQ